MYKKYTYTELKKLNESQCARYADDNGLSKRVTNNWYRPNSCYRKGNTVWLNRNMNAGGLCSNSRQCIKKRYPENRIYGDSNFDTYESQEIDLSYYKNRENLKNIIQFTSETSSNSDSIWNNLSLNESKSGNNDVVFESSTKNKISEVKLVGNTELQNGDIEISFYDNIPQLQDSDASSLKRKNSKTSFSK